MSRPIAALLVGGVLVAFVVGLVVGRGSAGEGSTSAATVPDPAPLATAAPTPRTPDVASTEPEPSPTTDSVATPDAEPPTTAPVLQLVDGSPPDFDEALRMTEVLAESIVLPSDCGLPLDEPPSLPNAGRPYRNGIHRGIDFICLERGREAVAALPGRVVAAVGDYVDPNPADREALLDVAAETGGTPPWTLVMLYGNHVVLDHGIIAGVGHVVSIHAHLDSVDPELRIGQQVEAGSRLGEIGDLGTGPASEGVEAPRSIHLHWELHVDDLYLGAGLDGSQTREIYRRLFENSP